MWIVKPKDLYMKREKKEIWLISMPDTFISAEYRQKHKYTPKSWKIKPVSKTSILNVTLYASVILTMRLQLWWRNASDRAVLRLGHMWIEPATFGSTFRTVLMLSQLSYFCWFMWRDLTDINTSCRHTCVKLHIHSKLVSFQ